MNESKRARCGWRGFVLRVLVLVVTVALLFLMFDRGGWWIAACLAWLPINFFVVAYFGDDKKSGSSPPYLGPD
jgi:hypothetical protein